MRSIGFSEQGRREQNADYFIEDTKNKIYIIADGAGDGNGAKQSSKIACEQVHAVLRSKETLPMFKLINAIHAADAAVEERFKGQEGTTIDILLFEYGWAYYAHVGDSQILHVRNGKAEKITRDHTKYDFETKRFYLAQAIGIEALPEIKQRPVSNNDLFAMTTDGIHGVLSENELEHMLTTGIALEDIAEQLKMITVVKGCPDNYTGILIRI